VTVSGTVSSKAARDKSLRLAKPAGMKFNKVSEKYSRIDREKT